MNYFKSILLAAGAIVCFASTASALEFDLSHLDEFKKTFHLGDGFNDEQLYKAAIAYEAAKMEETYGLKAHWTRSQYAKASAEGALARDRSEGRLQPGFNASEWVITDASRELASFISSHNVSPKFTEHDLRVAEGVSMGKYDTHLFSGGAEKALSYDEVAAAAGPIKAAQLAAKYHLSQEWTFEELREEAGPEEAASHNGLHAGMIHAEVVAALGENEAIETAHVHELPLHFSAQQLEDHWADFMIAELRQDYKIAVGQEINEATVFESLKAKFASNLHYYYPSLPKDFTEAQFREFLVQDEAEKLRSRYGLPESYGEDDVTAAYAASLVADIRLRYELPKHFGEADLAEKVKAEEAGMADQRKKCGYLCY